MPYYHQTQIMGVTGGAAELKFDEAGRPRCNFSVFVEEYWRDPATGDRKKLTTIYRCTAWNKSADHAAKVLKAGTWVFCVGRMRSRKHHDREYWSMTIDSFRLIERWSGNAEDESQETHFEGEA